jgi:hypothetical protein
MSATKSHGILEKLPLSTSWCDVKCLLHAMICISKCTLGNKVAKHTTPGMQCKVGRAWVNVVQ